MTRWKPRHTRKSTATDPYADALAVAARRGVIRRGLVRDATGHLRVEYR
ncbi:MAG TPA: hypothetical protein VGN37_30305 [Actinocatenispora sp.]